jgi:hypothetical protein
VVTVFVPRTVLEFAGLGLVVVEAVVVLEAEADRVPVGLADWLKDALAEPDTDAVMDGTDVNDDDRVLFAVAVGDPLTVIDTVPFVVGFVWPVRVPEADGLFVFVVVLVVVVDVEGLLELARLGVGLGVTGGVFVALGILVTVGLLVEVLDCVVVFVPVLVIWVVPVRATVFVGVRLG